MYPAEIALVFLRSKDDLMRSKGSMAWFTEIKLVRRPLDKLRYFFQIAVFCHRLTPVWNVKYFAIFLNAVRICREEKYSPEEAFRLGLFNPDFPRSEICKYISRRKLTKVQEAVNPVQWAPLLKDKSIFCRYCMALGVPVPKLYAIFFKKTAGWAYNGSVLTTPTEWKTFLDTQLPEEFVIKPAGGAGGKGFNIFRRTGSGFIDTSGKSYKTQQLYAIMLSDLDYDSFIIQERLKNHPEIVRLSDSLFLQTVRFITLVGRDNRCNILLAYLKPIVGENIIDNFERGLSGNVEARVSLDSGLLTPARQITSDGSGVATIPTHPRTRISFEGFKLPLWEQTRKLVEETAPKFLPLRAVGWDVAITPDGPRIVEGNIWWGPGSEHRCMDSVSEAILSLSIKSAATR